MAAREKEGPAKVVDWGMETLSFSVRIGDFDLQFFMRDDAAMEQCEKINATLRKHFVSRETADKMAEALRVDQQNELFDCPHESEAQCDCAERGNALWNKWIRLRDEALSAYRAEVEGK